MGKKRVTVQSLAIEADLDVDEALITLWDAGFDHILGPSDLLDRGEANRARRSLGLATRRERASESHWEALLGLNAADLAVMLQQAGVPRPYAGGKLTKKAQHRLAAIARERGATPPLGRQPIDAAADVVSSPLAWDSVGHVRELRCLTADQISAIHDALVTDFSADIDPIVPAGIKDLGLLESAASRPLTSLAGVSKYPTIEMGSAALVHAIVHDHPFHNGNKRTALVSMLVFLDMNGMVLTCDQDELFKLVLQLAQHALAAGPRHELPDREVLAVTEWLRTRVRWVEKGDRAITWRRLRRILTDLECDCSDTAGGNRIMVSRKVVRRKTGMFGRDRTITLTSSITNVADGREIDRNSMNRLRRELEVDEEHGIDTGAFYDDAPVSPSEFIKKYQKTLRRLARL